VAYLTTGAYNKGELPSVRIGNAIRVSASALKHYVSVLETISVSSTSNNAV
jgi:hypothetical protein